MRAMGLTRSWARTGCLLSSWWHGIRMDEEKQLHVDIFYLCLWRNWGVSKIYSDLGESRWLWEPFYFQVAHGKVKMYGYLWILCRMYCSRKNKKVFNETQVSTQWSHVNTYIFWLNVSCMLRITWCAGVWNLHSPPHPGAFGACSARGCSLEMGKSGQRCSINFQQSIVVIWYHVCPTRTCSTAMILFSLSEAMANCEAGSIFGKLS